MNKSLSINSNLEDAFNSLVFNCAMIENNEKILRITDPNTESIGNKLYKFCENYTEDLSHLTIPSFSNHGERVPKAIEEKMLKTNTIFGLTTKSMAHTKARLRASNNGIKYLSLPYYSEKVLLDKSLFIDFRNLVSKSEKLADIFSKGNKVHITTEIGTDLKFSIKNRIGNAAPGCCYKKGVIASPPDSETNIAIVENSTNGVLIVDGSIPIDGFGLLQHPIKINFKNGYAISFEGSNALLLESIFNSTKNKKSKIAAEFGIGLNPKAKLCGNMLQDEGALGTIHIGIGANSTIGGSNFVNFHLDHIICQPTVFIDSQLIMNEGKLSINF